MSHIPDFIIIRTVSRVPFFMLIFHIPNFILRHIPCSQMTPQAALPCAMYREEPAYRPHAGTRCRTFLTDNKSSVVAAAIKVQGEEDDTPQGQVGLIIRNNL